MTQFYFAGRVYGDISYRQPLTPDQVEQFILQTDETDDMEIYFAMNGIFLAPHFQSGVIFVDVPNQNTGQLFIKLKDSDTFWSIERCFYTDLENKAASLLKYADLLTMQIRHCVPITNHAEYRQKVVVLMEAMRKKDGRWIDILQVDFIKLEQQYGSFAWNQSIGATA